MIWKESISADKSWTYKYPRFRSIWTISRTFPTTLHRGAIVLESGWVVRAAHTSSGTIVDFEIGKARLSGGRWRPPVAQHERRDHGRTIVWRRLVSASVIIINEAKRCVGSVFACPIIS